LGTTSIKADMLRRMFLCGAKNLEIKKEWINDLNVFPVPDGDTGTNMTLTIKSAADEVERLENANMDALGKAISSGSLRGARGNSGVILSQLLRGFTKVVREHNSLDVRVLTEAMQKAVETAYKAVMKPKEGTILTVARMMAVKAAEADGTVKTMEEFFDLVLHEGDLALATTPELLPVLKEAGVVDSGGAGLMTVIHGAVDAFYGLEPQEDFTAPKVEIKRTEAPISTDEITFGYCTEFIVKLEKEFSEEDEEEMKSYLLSLGDSLVFVAGDDMVKVHVHTNHPGRAFEKGLEYGQLTRMKVDNMREEHQERLFNSSEVAAAKKEEEKLRKSLNVPAAEKERKEVAFVAVTVGDGLTALFKQLGVDEVIQGGQTMNPSTQDVLDAIKRAHAKDVFVLPNNKNVILTANQARDLTEDCSVHVIPTSSVPQGICAVISFAPERSADENASVMASEIANVKSGEVTYAVRDTSIDGVKICEGDIMGIGDKGLLAVGKSVEEVIPKMLEQMVDDESSVISIYNGADYSDEDAEALADEIADKYPDCDVEATNGGQPVFYCIISVE